MNNGSIGKLDGPGWTKQTALKAKRLLLEFHHVFSLEENEMGCTDAAKHVIELLEGEDEPFKERFRRIAHGIFYAEFKFAKIQNSHVEEGGGLWKFDAESKFVKIQNSHVEGGRGGALMEI